MKTDPIIPPEPSDVRPGPPDAGGQHRGQQFGRRDPGRADDQPDLWDARRFAVRLVREAGDLLRRGTRGSLRIAVKSDSGDVVTDLDLAAEQLIVSRIRDRYPAHGVIAEEGGVHADGREWSWLVDPLDGTNNVAIGLPTYVVGVALCERGRPVLGVVHDAVSGRTWSAVRGQGATVHGGGAPAGGRPLPAPRLSVPPTPVLAWTQGHDVRRDDSTAQALKLVLDSTARRVLRLWAPLLSWVMLARGDIDGMVGYLPEALDLPAGLLLAVESGMVVRALDGSVFDDHFDLPAARRSFVAAPPATIDRLVKLVAAARWVEPEVRRLTPVSLASIGW